MGKKFLNDSEIYGVKLKMAKIQEYEIEHSKGFVREMLQAKKEQIEREAKELEVKIGDNQVRTLKLQW